MNKIFFFNCQCIENFLLTRNIGIGSLTEFSLKIIDNFFVVRLFLVKFIFGSIMTIYFIITIMAFKLILVVSCHSLPYFLVCFHSLFRSCSILSVHFLNFFLIFRFRYRLCLKNYYRLFSLDFKIWSP